MQSRARSLRTGLLAIAVVAQVNTVTPLMLIIPLGVERVLGAAPYPVRDLTKGCCVLCAVAVRPGRARPAP